MGTTPQKIGRYEVKGQLGEGGMAVVYRGYDPLTGREVAIKVLSSELISDEDTQFQTRFQNEIRISASLEHPAIVPVYDVGNENGQPFLVMKNMRGGTLAQKIDGKPLGLRDTVQILEKIAPALDEAHAKRIVHRDIKPSNILYDNYGNPSISDFGIAKVLETQPSDVSKSGFVGTPAYMSPEQAQEQIVDGRSDVYSLGVVLYELLSGKQPPAVLTRLYATEAVPFPAILELNKELPLWVEDVVSKAMALDRNDRFITAGEMLETIKSHMRDDEIKTTEAKIVPKARLKPGIIVVVVFLVLMIGGLLKGNIFGPVQETPGPSQTITVTSMPTASKTLTITPSSSPSPTSTEITISEAETPLPSLPVLGGADKIAFLRENNIWIMNVDGSDIHSLTNDKTEKFNLEWSPDGSSIFYITQNKSLNMVNIETNKVETVTSFGGANYFEAFRISPDGTQIAISLNRQLHVVPYDLEKMRKATDKDDLLAMDGCLYYTGVEVEEVLWGSNGIDLAVKFAAGSTGPIADNIRVIDISHCRASTPVRLFEFPSPHFNFNRTIVYFDWDGENLFILNNDKRNNGFGNLGVYSTRTYLFRWITPIDNVCCYRDAVFSPDGTYVAFAFQDIRLGESNRIDLYYIDAGLLEANAHFQPIPLPLDFFNRRDQSLIPILRPAR